MKTASHAIDRRNKQVLPQQIGECIVTDIRTGKIKPGDRLPSERKLAKDFHVCRSTVSEALATLAKQRIIETVPKRGIFVKDKALPLKFALPYFTDTLPRREDHTEAGFIFSDQHAGFLGAATALGVELSFVHLKLTNAPRRLSEYVSRLTQFDAVIFREGDSAIFRRLQGKVVLVRTGNHVDPRYATSVTYDRALGYTELLKHVIRGGYRRAGVITVVTKQDTPYFRNLADAFLAAAAKQGLSVPPELNWQKTVPAYPFQRIHYEEHLLQYLNTLTPDDAVLCNSTETIGDLYYLASLLGKIPGRDFGVFGRGSGGCFAPLRPTVTYIKMPNFQIGFEAVNAAVAQVRTGGKPPQITLVPELIVGESTSRRTH